MKLYIHEIAAIVFGVAVLILVGTVQPSNLPSCLGFLAGWFGLSIAVGRLAAHGLRSRPGWMLLALLFSPPVAFIFLLVADVPHAAVVRR